jgi:hypothetical protein
MQTICSPFAALVGVKILKTGECCTLKEPTELVLEEGTTLRCGLELPRDLPIGYHTLRMLRTSEMIKDL